MASPFPELLLPGGRATGASQELMSSSLAKAPWTVWAGGSLGEVGTFGLGKKWAYWGLRKGQK